MKFNTNIFSNELRRGRTSLLVWCLSISAIILLGMSFYPILMEGDMLQQMTTLFENPFMKNMMAAFGATLDVLVNPLGFYSTRNAIFVMLLGSFFSIMLGGRILGREESDQTAEFLLTRPVTRLEVAAAKLAVFLTELVLLNLTILFIGYCSLEIFKGDVDYPLPAFFVHWVYSFLLMLTLGSAGFFLSMLIKRGRSITGASVGIVVGGYFIDAITRVTPAVDKIGWLSPFKFVDTQVLRPDYGLTWWRAGYFLGVSLLLFILSLVIYRKKDILI